MEKRGVYIFFNACIRDPLPPHNLLFKIGGGNIVDRFTCAEKAQGTYLPYGYEILAAKIIGEDWQVHEKHLHNVFASNRIIPKPGSGNGIEWFRNIKPEMIISELNNIPGEWYNPPIDGKDKLDIHRKCVELGIRDSYEYAQRKENDWLETPWDNNAYDFFNPNDSKISKEDFIKTVFIDNKILNSVDYEEFAKENKLPSLRQISDGYFGLRIGFHDLKEETVPSQRR